MQNDEDIPSMFGQMGFCRKPKGKPMGKPKVPEYYFMKVNDMDEKEMDSGTFGIQSGRGFNICLCRNEIRTWPF
jgi:hypothetical protein